jgi:hypothetical protein
MHVTGIDTYQESRYPRCRERGYVLVLNSLLVSLFAAMMAVMVVTFLIVSARLQQRNIIEYVALAILDCHVRNPLVSTADKISCGEILGKQRVIGSGGDLLLQPGDLSPENNNDDLVEFGQWIVGENGYQFLSVANGALTVDAVRVTSRVRSNLLKTPMIRILGMDSLPLFRTTIFAYYKAAGGLSDQHYFIVEEGS